MAWTKVSAGSGMHGNEDLVAVHEHDGVTEIVVIDGGTSVADRDYVDAQAGDVVWFVERFATELAAIVNPQIGQADLVMRAAAATGAAYRALAGATTPPAHAWPIAAMSWIRVVHGTESDTLLLYCLGDCKILLREPDGAVRDLDPYINPQEAVLQRVIAGLIAEGVSSSDARRARLLPLLRQRREEQNAALAPEILCMQPAGPFAARTMSIQAAPGATLLAMTDGFYRLSDPYELYTPAKLVDACVEHGVEAMLARLRAVEASTNLAGCSVKAADDASAVMWESLSLRRYRSGHESIGGIIC